MPRTALAALSVALLAAAGLADGRLPDPLVLAARHVASWGVAVAAFLFVFLPRDGRPEPGQNRKS